MALPSVQNYRAFHSLLLLHTRSRLAEREEGRGLKINGNRVPHKTGGLSTACLSFHLREHPVNMFITGWPTGGGWPMVMLGDCKSHGAALYPRLWRKKNQHWMLQFLQWALGWHFNSRMAFHIVISRRLRYEENSAYIWGCHEHAHKKGFKTSPQMTYTVNVSGEIRMLNKYFLLFIKNPACFLSLNFAIFW